MHTQQWATGDNAEDMAVGDKSHHSVGLSSIEGACTARCDGANVIASFIAPGQPLGGTIQRKCLHHTRPRMLSKRSACAGWVPSSALIAKYGVTGVVADSHCSLGSNQ